MDRKRSMEEFIHCLAADSSRNSPARPNHKPELRQADFDRLEAELDDARHTILRLLPDDVAGDLALTLAHLEGEACHDRTAHAIEHLLDDAEATIRVGPETSDPSPRAPCPLCGGGARSHTGYVFPFGLRQHLSGRPNGHQCSVAKHVFALAKANPWLFTG